MLGPISPSPQRALDAEPAAPLEEQLASLRSEVARLRELVHEGEDLRGTLDLLPDVVFKCILREDGEIVFVLSEGGFSSEMEATTKHVRGQPWSERLKRYPPEWAAAVRPAFERAFAGEETDLTASLGDRAFRQHLRPVRGPDGRVASVVGFVTEVTSLQRAQEQIRKLNDQLGHRVDELAGANRRLEEMDRARGQLVSAVSHELNNALTPIRLQLHLLFGPEAKLAERERRALRVVDRNVDRLCLLVEDLLDVGRLQAGRFAIAPAPIDLNRVIAEAVESFQEPARKAGVTLHVELTPGLQVDADPRRVIQVMFNLLGNAVKFTPSGGSISVATAREGDAAVVRVRDTGEGLRADDIPQLFQPFRQAPSSGSPNRGTGLGLYICRGIVEQHGGRIWCASEGPGKGATFGFGLPLERPTGDHAPTEGPAAARGAAEPAASAARA
jgi:signal transduction histidine kinase